MMTGTADRKRLLDDFEPHTYDQWKEAAIALLKGAPFDKKLITPTYEGFDLQPIYRREDIEGLPHLASLPGSGSQVRSAKATGYLETPWLVSQEMPYSTPREFNEAAVPDIARGQTELNILLDLAAQTGTDPDSSGANEVGACGLSIASLGDLEVALANIQVEKVSLYFQSGVVSMPMAALLVALARKRGIQADQLKGCFATDPLGRLSWSGTLPVSLDRAFRDMETLTRYAATHLPGMQTIEVNSNAYHNGGGNAVDEVACSLATGAAYLRELQARGLSADQVLPKMRFSMAIGSQFFPEIAKFRAARLLWTQVARAFAPDLETVPYHLHARTGIWNKTQYDPYVNMLRTTTEAFSAVIGGCDSMHVGPFDEILRVPNTFSRRIARNTHLVLGEECDLTRTIDPAGGSWAIESLTDQIARKAWDAFQEIEKSGGMAAALEAGLPQQKVETVRQKRTANIGKRRDLIVGTNIYPNATEKPLEVTMPDYGKMQKVRGEEIAEFRTSDSSGSHEAVLSSLENILQCDPEHLMEAAIGAAAVGATLGEISRTLWSGDGEKASATPIPVKRAAMEFEALRRKVEGAGGVPILQANLGPSRNYRARADWTSSFFQVGGFTMLNETDFDSDDDVIAATGKEKAPIVVICSTDDVYAERVADLAGKLKALDSAPRIIVAGAPGEQEDAWKKAGVDDFVHIRVNCYELLSQLAETFA